MKGKQKQDRHPPTTITEHAGLARIPPGLPFELPGVWFSEEEDIFGVSPKTRLGDVFLSTRAAQHHALTGAGEVRTVKLVRTSEGKVCLLGEEVLPRSGKSPEELRQQALGRLSPEEVEALGITSGATP